MTTNNNNNKNREQLTNACVIAYLNSINRLGRINLSVGFGRKEGQNLSQDRNQQQKRYGKNQSAAICHKFLSTHSLNLTPRTRRILLSAALHEMKFSATSSFHFSTYFLPFLLASNLWLSAHVSLKIYTQTCTHTHAHICIYINVKLACICVASMYKNVYIIRYMATRQ